MNNILLTLAAAGGTTGKVGSRESQDSAREQRLRRWQRPGLAVVASALAWFCAEQLGLLSMIPYIGRSTESMLYVLAVGIVLSFTRLQLLTVSAAAVLLLLWLVVAFSPLARALAPPLKVVTPTAALTPGVADAVVVLASGIQEDNEFGDASLARFLGGLGAVRRGLAPRLVLTEVAPPGSHQVAAQRLMAQLQVDCPVTTIGPVHDTNDEAVAVTKLARESGWKTIVLVTSPTHSKRSELVFRHAGRAVGWTVLSLPCQETSYDLENLITPSDRVRAFASALHEIIGIRVYRLRGWI